MCKKFLLISFAFPPMGVVGSLRPYRICRYLPQKGWLPEVITTYSRKGLPTDNTLLENIPSSVKINRVKYIDPLILYEQFKSKKKQNNSFEKKETTVSSKQKTLNSLLQKVKSTIIKILSTPDHQIFWNFSVLIKGIQILLREKNICFIMTSSPPHSSQLAGTILSYLFNKPHIVDFRDPWTDIFQFRRSTLQLRIEKLLESFVIKRAVKVISTTETYTELLRKRYKNLDPNKFITITNSFEPEKFESIESEYSNKFVICYLGIFYSDLNPYCFFKALSEWLNDYPEARKDTNFIIVGNGDPVTARIIQTYKLQDIVTITGRLAHHEAIKIAKSADLLLLCTGTGPKTPRGWIPSKLFEYLACRKPILANIPDGDAASIIRKTKTGYVITSDDSEKIKNILLTEYNRKKQKKSYSVEVFNPNTSEIYKYSVHYTINKLIDIFEEIC